MKIENLKLKINNIISPVLVIAFAALMRLLPHPPNVAPIAAMALFGGVYLNKKSALIFPLLALFISDLFIGFYATPMMLSVYGSFLLTGLIGVIVKKHKNPSIIIIASLFSSFLFYLITNFGVWLFTPLYPRTLAGLLDSYIMAIPFFRNTILGDLLYTGLFFGTYEIVLKVLKLKLKILIR